MRGIIAMAASLVALLAITPQNVDAAGRSKVPRAEAIQKAKPLKRTAAVKSRQARAIAERAAASIGANGLCQRDTGTPTSALDLRNRCDTEEFWGRMNDLGSSAGED